MNVLIIGSGGREHALAWKIQQSSKCEKLIVAPGNAGTASVAKNVAADPEDFESMGKLVLSEKIDLVVVGPEAPLVKGIRDYFQNTADLKHVLVVGPGKNGAQLEGSKDFSKSFMTRHGIPTAKAKTFTADEIDKALQYIDSCDTPIVVKADGLAAGKGVIICADREEASKAIENILAEKQFGEAGSKILIEEYLEGIELSVFVLTDGKDYVILPEAKDYKRIGEGDTGPNTGGMGAISPVDFASGEFMDAVRTQVVQPTISGLSSEGIDYKGFIFIGLMNVGGVPYVIEYNVRMGDPETQAVMPRLRSDLLVLLEATARGELSSQKVEISGDYAATVVLASEGYPGAYEKGKKMQGLSEVNDALSFHAGTKMVDSQVVTSGGRVMAITGMDQTLAQALTKAYNAVSQVCWEGMSFRKDIGKDLQ